MKFTGLQGFIIKGRFRARPLHDLISFYLFIYSYTLYKIYLIVYINCSCFDFFSTLWFVLFGLGLCCLITSQFGNGIASFFCMFLYLHVI